LNRERLFKTILLSVHDSHPWRPHESGSGAESYFIPGLLRRYLLRNDIDSVAIFPVIASEAKQSLDCVVTAMTGSEMEWFEISAVILRT
jgi:hypothetical protein